MKPGEHKTVQARILAYAQEIGWAFVSREEAEERRGGIPAPLRRKDGDRNVPTPLGNSKNTGWKTRPPLETSKDGDRNVPTPFGDSKNTGRNAHAPLEVFFGELLDAKVREFNPRYAEAEGALPGRFRHLHADIYGNREFVDYLRNQGKFFDHEEKRERA